MIPNPIRKVLSSMNASGAKAMLMGGQACVLFGAAEFSKDSDFAVLASPENMASLQGVLDDLQAKNVAVPPFEMDFLERGHAVHFRCFHPDCEGIRVDLMSKMRGVAAFDELWERRTTFHFPDGEITTLDINDLVQAKKTQRDKDWPMISRLVQRHFFDKFPLHATAKAVAFWFAELRSSALLLQLARDFPDFDSQREAALLALQGASEQQIERALRDEEERERQLDRIYWRPLKAELEAIRLKRNRNQGEP